MNANEDGLLSVHSRRSRTPVQLTVPGAAVREFRDQIEAAVNSRRSRTPVQPAVHAAAVREFRDQIEAAVTSLRDMGILQTYGEELCRFMLHRHNGDVLRAVEALYDF
jgi:D-aminopeptidase